MMSTPIAEPTIVVSPTTYTIDGEVYDRVTTCLSAWPAPELQSWREAVGKAVANRDLRHGEKVGTEVDHAITRLLKGELPAPSKSVEVRQCLRGFQEWHRLNPIQPRFLQKTLWNPLDHLAGTADCITEEEVIDWKTGSQLRWPNVFQVLLYWQMEVTRRGGLDADRHLRQARLVRFDKILGTWEEKVVEWDQHLFMTAIQTCKVYQAWKQLTQPAEVASCP